MRNIVVTGANKGIGKAIVEAILDGHSDTTVFLGSRDRGRGEAARSDLVQDHPDWADRVAVLELDVTDDASVAAAARAVEARFAGDTAPLYGLVNNAGVGFGSSSLRQVLDVNAHGVRRVTEAFVPLLDPDAGRIVNVTSAAGPMFVSGCDDAKRRFLTDPSITRGQLLQFMAECVELEDDAAFAAAGLGKRDAYGLSKACANAFTLITAREHGHLRVNACTPGFIETDMTRPWADEAGKAPAEMGMKPPSSGTRAPMHLLFGALDGNGRYYGSDALRSPLDRYRGPGTPEYAGE